MQLISDEYRKLNEQLHANPEYGTSGREYVHYVADLAKSMNTTDILDYGCGKGTLGMHFPFTLKQYDPAIPRYTALPDPADIVVCTDVLEHIEPVYIGEVMDHLQSLTKKILFATVATWPAKKTLPDGRNAHLIVESPRWWINSFMDRFEILNYNAGEKHILIVARPLEKCVS